MELYRTGIMDAMYLAGMVADGAKMTREQLNEWAEGAEGLQMIAEYTVPWVTVENANARALAMKWIEEQEGACGCVRMVHVVRADGDVRMRSLTWGRLRR